MKLSEFTVFGGTKRHKVEGSISIGHTTFTTDAYRFQEIERETKN